MTLTNDFLNDASETTFEKEEAKSQERQTRFNIATDMWAKFMTLMGDGNLQGTESALVCNVLGTVKGIVKPNGKCVRPKKGRLWFRLLPFRRRLLWIYRKKLKFGI